MEKNISKSHYDIFIFQEAIFRIQRENVDDASPQLNNAFSPETEVTDGTENNAVHVNHKTESDDGKPNEDAGPNPDEKESNAVPVTYKVESTNGKPNEDAGPNPDEKANNAVPIAHKVEPIEDEPNEDAGPNPDEKATNAVPVAHKVEPIEDEPSEDAGPYPDEKATNAVPVAHKVEPIEDEPSEDAGPYPDEKATNAVPVAHKVQPIEDEPSEDAGPYPDEKASNAVPIAHKVEPNEDEPSEDAGPYPDEKATDAVPVAHKIDLIDGKPNEDAGSYPKVESTDKKQKDNATSCPERESSRDISPFSGPIVAERVERIDDNAAHVNYKEKHTSSKSNSPLSTPVEKNHKSASPPKCPLIQVIEKTENKESILDSKGMKDIHKAAERGLSDEVVISLNNGEDPSALTSSNNTPLHYAANILLHRSCTAVPRQKCDSKPLE
ncbi:uncharacterized protein LOC122245153 [Penaeus japonicus]|uniref:uncharacterized protein LOC122245153 n=1 Tax=Penaeus japonicus TaxID=27405 RepID=UPI001C7126D4|nr:uncharacterized protein LOC122245153 [Penaeus japonicus]